MSQPADTQQQLSGSLHSSSPDAHATTSPGSDTDYTIGSLFTGPQAPSIPGVHNVDLGSSLSTGSVSIACHARPYHQGRRIAARSRGASRFGTFRNTRYPFHITQLYFRNKGSDHTTALSGRVPPGCRFPLGADGGWRLRNVGTDALITRL